MEIHDKIKIYSREKIEDNRGWFLKVINGKEESLPQFTGEIYVTSAKPGEIRGNHYHNLTNEWFTLIKGKCILKLYDLAEKSNLNIELDSEVPQTIFVPAKIAHAFMNNLENEDFIILAYSDKFHDPKDTIPLIV
jgi:dTDP-4-dehydrorhamnose 3,5-epimerase-like enzyme